MVQTAARNESLGTQRRRWAFAALTLVALTMGCQPPPAASVTTASGESGTTAQEAENGSPTASNAESPARHNAQCEAESNAETDTPRERTENACAETSAPRERPQDASAEPSAATGSPEPCIVSQGDVPALSTCLKVVMAQVSGCALEDVRARAVSLVGSLPECQPIASAPHQVQAQVQWATAAHADVQLSLQLQVASPVPAQGSLQGLVPAHCSP